MKKIKNFIRSIKNLFYYFIVIWNDRDDDYIFLHYLLLKKLKKTYKLYENNIYFFDQDLYLTKPLRICIEILEREKNDFYDNTTNNIEKLGDNIFLNGDKCENRNKNILYDILKKYTYYWWY